MLADKLRTAIIARENIKRAGATARRGSASMSAAPGFVAASDVRPAGWCSAIGQIFDNFTRSGDQTWQIKF
jgi:hypothetical protein